MVQKENNLLIIFTIIAFAMGYITCLHLDPKLKETAKPIIEYEYIYKIDTIRIFENKYIPKIISKTKTDTLFLTRTDTLKVVEEYFYRNFYADTLINDSTLFCAIYDTIYKNMIANRQFFIKQHKNTQLTQIQQVKTKNKNFKLGVGAYISADVVTPSLINKVNFGVGTSILFYKNNIVLNYDFSKKISVGYYRYF